MRVQTTSKVIQFLHPLPLPLPAAADAAAAAAAAAVAAAAAADASPLAPPPLPLLKLPPLLSLLPPLQQTSLKNKEANRQDRPCPTNGDVYLRRIYAKSTPKSSLFFPAGGGCDFWRQDQM